MYARASIQYTIRYTIENTEKNERVYKQQVGMDVERERNRWESLEEMPRKRGCPERGWMGGIGGEYAGGIYIP
jgi:hypothetical protein